jgi:hypothetical protein
MAKCTACDNDISVGQDGLPPAACGNCGAAVPADTRTAMIYGRDTESESAKYSLVVPVPVMVVAFILIGGASLFALAGYQQMQSDPRVVGGDAYNFIIGATRGVGMICIGLILAVVACALLAIWRRS